jgi:hypothetical protein
MYLYSNKDFINPSKPKILFMKFQIIALLWILSLIYFPAIAQDTDSTEQKSQEYVTYRGNKFLFLSVGYHLNTYHAGECRLIWGAGGLGYLVGFSAGSEFVFKPKDFTFAPKIAYEFQMLFLGARLNMLYYTNSRGNSLKFRPEAGLSFFGLGHIFYGYNITITNKDFVPVRHHFTVGINLPVAEKWESLPPVIVR